MPRNILTSLINRSIIGIESIIRTKVSFSLKKLKKGGKEMFTVFIEIAIGLIVMLTVGMLTRDGLDFWGALKRALGLSLFTAISALIAIDLMYWTNGTTELAWYQIPLAFGAGAGLLIAGVVACFGFVATIFSWCEVFAEAVIGAFRLSQAS